MEKSPLSFLTFSDSLSEEYLYIADTLYMHVKTCIHHLRLDLQEKFSYVPHSFNYFAMAFNLKKNLKTFSTCLQASFLPKI